jgi:hypothetical protein
MHFAQKKERKKERNLQTKQIRRKENDESSNSNSNNGNNNGNNNKIPTAHIKLFHIFLRETVPLLSPTFLYCRFVLLRHLRFFTKVAVLIPFTWVKKPCSMASGYQHFGESHCFYLQFWKH